LSLGTFWFLGTLKWFLGIVRGKRGSLRACISQGVYVRGVHLIGLHVIGVHLIGLHVIGMHLIGLHLLGVHPNRSAEPKLVRKVTKDGEKLERHRTFNEDHD
jgi:quinol-cytochrome oxidoreductase complex cytochrome b subunit